MRENASVSDSLYRLQQQDFVLMGENGMPAKKQGACNEYQRTEEDRPRENAYNCFQQHCCSNDNRKPADEFRQFTDGNL